MDTANETGFRKMINGFEPHYTPPDRKTIATHYLQQMFETEKECTREAVRSAEYYAVTTDLWTSRAKHAYTSIKSVEISVCRVAFWRPRSLLTITQPPTLLRSWRSFSRSGICQWTNSLLLPLTVVQTLSLQLRSLNGSGCHASATPCSLL